MRLCKSSINIIICILLHHNIFYNYYFHLHIYNLQLVYMNIIQIFPSPKCSNISYYFLPGFCVFNLKCNLHAYLEKDRDWNRFTKIQKLYTISHNSAIFFCLYCKLLVYLCTGKQREYKCNGNNYRIGSSCNNDIFLLYFPRNALIKGVHWIFYYSCGLITYFYWVNSYFIFKKI